MTLRVRVREEVGKGKGEVGKGKGEVGKGKGDGGMEKEGGCSLPLLLPLGCVSPACEVQGR